MTAHTTPTGRDLDPVFFPPSPAAVKAVNTGLITAFCARHGNLGGAFDGEPVSLLTTTGARGGIPAHPAPQAPGLA